MAGRLSVPPVSSGLALRDIDLTVLRSSIDEQNMKDVGGKGQHQLASLVSLQSTKPKR